MNPIGRLHIFQMGWFNHQLDDDVIDIFTLHDMVDLYGRCREIYHN